jgi:NADPH:quinone reductase-like Zn-dependent oxidoreductase
MKAILRTVYGPAESLSFQEVPMPELGDTEVLVKVHASSANPYDWHLVRGEPYLIRVNAGYRRPKNHDVGIDVAGTVDAVGATVTRFKIGDDVFGLARGAFAEYAAADEMRLASMPEGLTFASAASIQGSDPIRNVRARQRRIRRRWFLRGADRQVTRRRSDRSV